MRFEDERYVRVYTRDTPSWMSLKWEGQAVFALLLRKIDRAGVLDCSGLPPVDALEAVLGVPREVAEHGLAALLRRGTVEHRGDALVVPRFLEAQECAQSDAARQRASREKARARAMEGSRTTGAPPDEESSRNVTESHAASHAVTDGHSVPSRTVLTQDPPIAPRGGPPRPSAGQRNRGTRIPDDWAPSSELVAWARREVPGLNVDRAVAEFVDHWRAVPGGRGLKLDWDGTFRNRVRMLAERVPAPRNAPPQSGLFTRPTLLQPPAKNGQYDWKTKMQTNAGGA